MIRIFIADEQPVVLAGLRWFFSGTEFQVVGEASSGLDLVRGIEHSCPHLVLIDTNQMSFQGFTENLLRGATKNCRWRFKMIEYSAMLKSVSKIRLLETIRKMAQDYDGRSTYGSALRGCKGNKDKKSDVGKPHLLTPREIEILRLIVQGQCNKEIARSLGITLDTVKEHVQNILRKTAQSDRTQAALWAVRQEIASL